MNPILEFDQVSVDYSLPQSQSLRAVREVSFHIEPEESFALVGESGSGKSTLARAALRLLPASTGTVRIGGEDLAPLRGRELRKVRHRVQMVFQDPYSSLDPSTTVGQSLGEPLRVHRMASRKEIKSKIGGLLEVVGLPASYADRYPHEFSGGQRQRIAIARALAVQPDLLVCDEAVSALDVSTQNQIVTLLASLRKELGMAILFITHDLALVRHIADRVGVMYMGRLVEVAPVEELFTRPAHPYTAALLSAIPIANPVVQKARVRIPLIGEIPDPSNPPQGCLYHTRCPFSQKRCREERPLLHRVDESSVACHFPHVADDTQNQINVDPIQNTKNPTK